MVNIISQRFVESTDTMLQQFLFSQFEKSEQTIFESHKSFGVKDVHVEISFHGHQDNQKIMGKFVASFSEETALKIYSMMMGGMPVAEFDDMGKSAVSEMTNMISGQTSIQLNTDNITIDINPPSLIYGQNKTYFPDLEGVKTTLISGDAHEVDIYVMTHE
jgi:chemotaxis protein CheX